MKSALKIDVEGTDGAGKTTALKYLIERLQASGKAVLETREVGSPLIPVNVEIRKAVLDPESGLCGEAMEVLFAGMRILNEQYYKRVKTAYDFIVSDRGWLSHLAYTDHNVNAEFTDRLYTILEEITPMPDIVVYLSVNTETALKRRIKRGEGMDVIEMKGVEFQEKVRVSFNARMEEMNIYSPDTVLFLVDANEDVNGVREQIDAIVGKIVSMREEVV